ncbi:MAG TPA: acetate kinase [Pseudomonadales bacterium]|jgi:acetate kinase
MKHLLAVNAGSSSLKLVLYAMSDQPQPVWSAHATGIAGSHPALQWQHKNRAADSIRLLSTDTYADVLQQALATLGEQRIDAVVHRIVHGGAAHHGPERLDDAVIRELEALVALAPLHQPVGLALVALCFQQLPDATAYACYDTDFHRSLPALEYRVPLPSPWPERGVRHYGFHGISYQYLFHRLTAANPALSDARVVLAHLGAGASLCAVQGGQSCATSMGFSALEGVPMATRSGRLDAGIILYLLRQGLDAEALEDLLYRHSGLKALSGLSGDMQTLLAHDSDAARFAVTYFCDRVAREIAGMASAMGGMDALVFSGGIGEHAAPVRERIIKRCEWLGVQLDADANQAHADKLSRPSSPVACYRLISDEALSMAMQVRHLWGAKAQA